MSRTGTSKATFGSSAMTTQQAGDRREVLIETIVGGEALARRFHETYERLAPDFGYETRQETREFDPATPNGSLMIAVCSELIALDTPATEEDARECLAGEDFLSQLRRVNTERYGAWATQPLMLCEHCGRDRASAEESGHNFCIAPFDHREHGFTKPHPYLTVSNDAGIMFDALELGGEVGELLNVVKKMEREDRGWRGSRAGPDDFGDECADVLICLDKLARRRGVDLMAVTVRKFNATSDKVSLPHRLTLRTSGVSQKGSGNE